MNLIGISANYHDSAAVFVRDGHVVSAAQEERFTRKRHDADFPERALRYCLETCGQGARVDAVVFYEKPLRKFQRIMRMHLAAAPDGLESFAASMPQWIGGKLFQARDLEARLARVLGAAWSGELLFAEHHQSHAASAFFASPFDRAAVITMDGVGEWTTTSIALGTGNMLEPREEIRFPHSLGLLYSAFTSYLGFKANSGEYKVMGLAPYGTPRYRDLILNNVLDLKADGSFRLDMRYFGFCSRLEMTTPALHELLGRPPRQPESELEPFHMDMAASIQAVLELAVVRLAHHAAEICEVRNLCLAGGVALNCVANAQILRARTFERIWIQPASGDAGGALGAALAAYHGHFGRPRRLFGSDAMHGSLLGPSYSTAEITDRLQALGARVHVRADAGAMLEEVVEALTKGFVIGWFQGRMEYGPRALGARSILADPRVPELHRTLNLKIKYRESFRPFAPAVPLECTTDWFDLEVESPYMLLVAPVREDKRREVGDARDLGGMRSEIPAVTHVDWSARVQTVEREINPRFHELLSAFGRRTGCPVLVNTSFNVRGEPIVCAPEDAFRCFMGTDLDMLVAEDCVLYKAEQPDHLKRSYHDQVARD